MKEESPTNNKNRFIYTFLDSTQVGLINQAPSQDESSPFRIDYFLRNIIRKIERK